MLYGVLPDNAKVKEEVKKGVKMALEFAKCFRDC
jgi:hypothetical protein